MARPSTRRAGGGTQLFHVRYAPGAAESMIFLILPQKLVNYRFRSSNSWTKSVLVPSMKDPKVEEGIVGGWQHGPHHLRDSNSIDRSWFGGSSLERSWRLAASWVHGLVFSMSAAGEGILSPVVASFEHGALAGLTWWRVFKAAVMVPALELAAVLCLLMSVMMITEKLFMGAVSLYVKVLRRRPERVYRWEPVGGAGGGEDVELGSLLACPNVLVQIPMFNEKEVYKLSIGAACRLAWPRDRLIIQILDDSTDPMIKELVKEECHEWCRRGLNINYETRGNRKGYKAGALKEGMKHSYVRTCDYVAIFDADFQPEPDFLTRTVPFLVWNPEVALVQARWKFVNADECLMTRIQEMSMDYHFKVEQESGSSTHAFFGFNGTAGVWRIVALEEAGGWKDRTTVEDMDLAVRVSLRGWKFVYVGEVKVKSELPSTFKAYRNQQHRWSCGPANLLRKMAKEIIETQKVSIWKKFFVIYNFFIARRIVAHIVTFFFYCVIIPTSVFFPQVYIPTWGVVYVPTTITLLNAVGTPSSFHLIILWVLFENVMSMHRTRAVIVGLLQVGKVNEWIVTEKLGNAAKTKTNDSVILPMRHQSKILDRFHLLELGLGVYLMLCASYDCVYGRNYYYTFIFPQSLAFLIMGLVMSGLSSHLQVVDRKSCRLHDYW
ncbi:hypothetical protein Taro_038710 [Colocasia esculenta]|uniref:glucomannan 4-beta-mannosyltransferase n=1 Tax=Colocasia esculenta TaxID=4460 RepID=A0A843W486_COLES|nr:hypothetical protein [Colocasia esculenta]